MPAPAPAKTAAKVETEYVILRENVASTASANAPATLTGTHNVVKTVTAANADAAIRQAAGEKPGVYRAIPARSWRPVTVTVETKTTVKLT